MVVTSIQKVLICCSSYKIAKCTLICHHYIILNSCICIKSVPLHLRSFHILWLLNRGCQSWYRGGVLVCQTLEPQSNCNMLFPFTVAWRGNNRLLTAQLIRGIIQGEAHKRMIVTLLSSFSLLLLLTLSLSVSVSGLDLSSMWRVDILSTQTAVMVSSRLSELTCSQRS